ncbi:VgrG-related protein [Sodalinema gerasimenkoae]|uniref:VgrG-related protein n=1 Tax=Sodalinema gerasimenkoae TaxID=2862348 RepID=UPI0013595CD3|nr:VgrG-related protein [Sodalinema gerasimenkoae]
MSTHCKLQLKINGVPASITLIEDILQVSIEESLHAPSMFVIVIRNDYFPSGQEEPSWKHQDMMEIGKEIKIGFQEEGNQYLSTQEDNGGYIFEGEITAIETHFTEQSQAPIVIRGYDVSHRLHRGRWNRSFQNMTDSDVVKKIAKEAGINLGIIDSSGESHDYLFQQNQTNMEFLRGRAASLGFELFVSNGKLNFKKPREEQTLKLKWLKDISSFRIRITSAEQVKEVEVRAWDYKSKKPIISRVSHSEVLTETDNGRGSEFSSPFKGQPKNPIMRIVDRPVSSPKEANVMAQALFDELSGQFIYADAKAEGNTAIRPGRIIELENMGSHNGKYYVTETQHNYFESLYETEFSIRGLRDSNLLSTLTSSHRLLPSQTCIIGIVTNNSDPEGLNRCKVKFPSLTEDHESQWARVVGTGAGSKRGLDWLPEIDDEVLVAFEHGDIHRPYILGSVWNGVDSPSEEIDNSVVDGKVRLRSIKTTSGHQIQFIEEDKGSSHSGITISTNSGNKISIDDTENSITVETKNGQKIQVDDSEKSIQVSSLGNLNVQALQGIKLESKTGTIEINELGISITTPSIIKINGSLIQLN